MPAKIANLHLPGQDRRKAIGSGGFQAGHATGFIEVGLLQFGQRFQALLHFQCRRAGLFLHLLRPARQHDNRPRERGPRTGGIILILGEQDKSQPALVAGLELAQGDLGVAGKRPLPGGRRPLLHQLAGLRLVRAPIQRHRA